MELATRSELRWALVRAMAVVATLVVLFAAITSKLGADGRAIWFFNLKKPDGLLTPEAFTLWWALMFLLLGLALAIVWQARGATFRRLALIALAEVLLLALAWVPITFGFRQLFVGMAVGAMLAVSAIAAMFFAFRVRKSAGLLMLPVALWSLFSAYAAFQLWQLNGSDAVVETPDANSNMSGQNVPFATQ